MKYSEILAANKAMLTINIGNGSNMGRIKLKRTIARG